MYTQNCLNKKTNRRIIKNQEYFFDQSSRRDRVINYDTMFYDYVNKEQINGLKWIEDRKNILEYGCSVGNTLELFFKTHDQKKYSIYGVDISGGSISRIKKKYPNYTFYKISNNKIPQIKDGTMDAVFITHVLHHSHNHKDIFKEIHKKLKKGGKFLINDLSSSNLFNKTARSLFIRMPNFVKNKFSDDLVVEESIPDKYKVNIERTIKLLKKTGFKIERVGYGHLFVFVIGWIDRFIPLSKIGIVQSIYRQMMKLEQWLLTFKIFQSQAEVFSINAVKS